MIQWKLFLVTRGRDNVPMILKDSASRLRRMQRLQRSITTSLRSFQEEKSQEFSFPHQILACKTSFIRKFCHSKIHQNRQGYVPSKESELTSVRFFFWHSHFNPQRANVTPKRRKEFSARSRCSLLRAEHWKGLLWRLGLSRKERRDFRG